MAGILKRAKDALEDMDTDRLMPLYREDAVFEDVSAGQRLEGTRAIRTMFERMFAAPGVRFSSVKVYEAEDWGAIEWVWSGVRPSDGKPFAVRGASILELRDGLVTRESIYMDPAPAAPPAPHPTRQSGAASVSTVQDP